MTWSKEDCKRWLPFVQAVADGKKVKLTYGNFNGTLGSKECLSLEGEPYLPILFENYGYISTDELEVMDDEG